MFGDKQRLERKPSEQGGVVAWGTITDAAIRSTSSGHTSGADMYAPGENKHCEVRVRVEPEGQPAFEANFRLTFSHPLPHPGWRAKVIYDPNNRSKIAIHQILPPSGPVSFVVTDHGVKKPVAADQLTRLFTGGGAAKDGVADELSKLADLRDRGTLTESEFEAEKAKLLLAG